MQFDKDVLAGKLRRWEKFLYNYRLPEWRDIPDFGLYMDQVIALIAGYLDYMPPELKDGAVVTTSAINNYVRLKVMPGPEKKRYYRRHIVYLILICTLKQTLSITQISKLLPCDMPDEALNAFYDTYVDLHRECARDFIEDVRAHCQPILEKSEQSEPCAQALLLRSTILGGFSTAFAQKTMLLDGLTPESPDMDLNVPERRA